LLAKRAGLAKGRSILIFPGQEARETLAMERFEALKWALAKKRIRSAWALGPGEPGPAEALRVPSLLTLGALCAHAGWAIGNDSGPATSPLPRAPDIDAFRARGPARMAPYEPSRALAVQPQSGKIGDLKLETVIEDASLWLQRKK